MSSNSSSLTISSDLSNVSLVFDWLEKKLYKLIENKSKIDTLSVIIQEAVVNAIIHGNKEDKSKNVTLSYTLSKNLHLEIQDEGEGISFKNKEKSSDLIKPEDLLKESGRGIILMKHFCKEVIFKKRSVELIVEL